MASLKINLTQTHQLQFNTKSFQHVNYSLFSYPKFINFSGSNFGLNTTHSLNNDNSPVIHEIPILSFEEVIERYRWSRDGQKCSQEFLAMYSSLFGGIVTDTAFMLIPIDDHMVHCCHGVFDTTLIVDGHLYELDQHLDRLLRSARMAKIELPFDEDTIRSTLIQTVSASKCKNGSLQYWLSAGPGDFQLSPSSSSQSAFYAIVISNESMFDRRKGVKVITSSIPIKPPTFATVESVDYLPNVLSKMEAEEKGCFAAIWLDDSGFVAEASNMNVAFVTNEKELVMPRFKSVLRGCTANRVLTLARQLFRTGELRGVSVRDVTVEEGKKVEEMMLIGSGAVCPVIQWDDQVIGNGKEGPIAGALLDLLFEDMKSGPPSVRVPVPY